MNKFYRRLYNPKFLRYCFFILWILSIILNLTIHNVSLFILYVLAVICLGAGYYNKSNTFLAVLTIIVVLCRFFFIPDSVGNITSLLVLVLTYLPITFISAGFMKYAQKAKNDKLELTTALVNALDSRDAYTLHHSENVAKYAVALAEEMNLNQEQCEILHIGGLLHDIGKIGIPEHILTKPEKLTNEEYELIKKHPTIGYNIIKHVSSFSNTGVLDIILYHHERYDGKGYPKGLKGQQIPLLARILAVADTFDAITSKRIYRQEHDLDFALEEIRKHKGTQFDPDIADVFLNLVRQDDFKIKAYDMKLRTYLENT